MAATQEAGEESFYHVSMAHDDFGNLRSYTLILYHCFLNGHLRLIRHGQMADVTQPHGALTAFNLDIRRRLIRLAQRWIMILARRGRSANPILGSRRWKILHTRHRLREHAVVAHIHRALPRRVWLWPGTTRCGVALPSTLD